MTNDAAMEVKGDTSQKRLGIIAIGSQWQGDLDVLEMIQSDQKRMDG